MYPTRSAAEGEVRGINWKWKKGCQKSSWDLTCLVSFQNSETVLCAEAPDFGFAVHG